MLCMILGFFGVIGSGILFVQKPGGSNLLALPGKITRVLLLFISLLLIVIGSIVIIAPQDFLEMIQQHFTGA